jgi:peptidoglycan/LPS O-acetylase OafA/YrhL
LIIEITLLCYKQSCCRAWCFGAADAVAAPQWFRFAVVSAIVVGLATLVAHISYRAIEHPFEEHGKRLVKRLSEARHPAAFRRAAE